MSSIYSKIPDRYQVGGTEIEVRRVERCDDNAIGQAFTAAGFIEIANKYGRNMQQSESSKVNSFYHELTHTILGMMGHELNDDEKFVNTFSSFLTEAMRDAVFYVGEEKETRPVNSTLDIPEKYKDR
ncbi:MAG: hypothetical protein J6T22_09490 [Bacteroidales bacterium]|nr:hypothetical protein [Bacteroidales bacterium]MBO7617427.1 hypothetical protein [Bacteroidales bacterium]